MDNGPALWRAILEDCPPGAFVAGGAVRDYLLGVTAKDIDVFAPSDSLREWETPHFGPIEPRDLRADEYAASAEIDVVWRGTRHGWATDLIFMKSDGLLNWDPASVVSGFDFGITQAWWDGGLNLAPAFERDMGRGTVTLLRHDKLVRAMARFERFNERHGGAWALEGLQHGPR